MNGQKRLAKASFNANSPLSAVQYPSYIVPSINASGDINLSYFEAIKRCRFFYENDAIAGTVINRMCDIATTKIRNKHKRYSKEIKNYYDGIAQLIFPVLSQIYLSYLLDGMSIPQYRTDRIMGNRLHQDLGRTRYYYPKAVWVRNSENIILRKSPLGERLVYIKIPVEDKNLINSQGKPDREQEYRDLVALYPDYVATIKAGKTTFRLECTPIFRKMTTYNTYPIPFLKNSLGALDYRRGLKRMDKLTADRVIEAFRQIKVGSDEYPADDEDIAAAQVALQAHTTQDTIFNIYTNHTIEIKWIVPPIDSLLDDDKYKEANADVFLSMGFPRLWAVGENERSNTADNKVASVGPIASLESMRLDTLAWVRSLYKDLADLNGFVYYPEPYFMPISIASASDLIMYATQFIEAGVISKNTGALLYGTDYAAEEEQMQMEPKEDTEGVNNNADPNQRQDKETTDPEGI